MERILKLLLLLFHFIVNLYHTNSNLRVRYFMKLKIIFLPIYLVVSILFATFASTKMKHLFFDV